MASNSFQIISSLRYDPELLAVFAGRRASSNDLLSSPYYLLPYHQDRLRDAASSFNWQHALTFLQKDLDQFVRFLDMSIPDKAKPWRVRIVLDRDGDCKVEVHPTAPINPRNFTIPSSIAKPDSPVWRVYVDGNYTTPSEFTTHKTTARDFYTAARLRAGIISPQDTAEVLLVNPEGEVMEGSITTPYFKRRWNTGQSALEWITPPLSSGGNAGTTRRYALAQGFCTEQTIAATDLIDGEECLLSNGVRGFIRGRIVRGSSG